MMVMLKVPAVVVLNVSVTIDIAPAVRVTCSKLRDVVIPGVLVAERSMVPAKLYRLEIVMVDVPVEPACTDAREGLDVTLNDGATTRTNFKFAGAEDPSTYSRSIEGLEPVILRLVTRLSTAVLSHVIVAFHALPEGILM